MLRKPKLSSEWKENHCFRTPTLNAVNCGIQRIEGKDRHYENKNKTPEKLPCTHKIERSKKLSGLDTWDTAANLK